MTKQQFLRAIFDGFVAAQVEREREAQRQADRVAWSPILFQLLILACLIAGIVSEVMG